MPKNTQQFGLKNYLFRRKVLKIFGGAFHVFDAAGKVVMFCKQEVFALKENLRIYSDETMAGEILTILTPQIFDEWPAYTVTDSSSGELVGVVKRRAWKSVIKDEWIIISASGTEAGYLKEADPGMAFLSRILPFITREYVITDKTGNVQARLIRHFNPFILKYTMNVENNPDIDPRLLIACAFLLCAIEKRED
jgi:uncharacterized protein YxjI